MVTAQTALAMSGRKESGRKLVFRNALQEEVPRLQRIYNASWCRPDALKKSGFEIVEQESIAADIVPPYIKYIVGSRWYWFLIQPECLFTFGFVLYPFDYIRVKAIKPISSN